MVVRTRPVSGGLSGRRRPSAAKRKAASRRLKGKRTLAGKKKAAKKSASSGSAASKKKKAGTKRFLLIDKSGKTSQWRSAVKSGKGVALAGKKKRKAKRLRGDAPLPQAPAAKGKSKAKGGAKRKYILVDRKRNTAQSFRNKTSKKSTFLHGSQQELVNLLIMAAGGIAGFFLMKKIGSSDFVKNQTGAIGKNIGIIFGAGAMATGILIPQFVPQVGKNQQLKLAFHGLAVAGAVTGAVDWLDKNTGTTGTGLYGRVVRPQLGRTVRPSLPTGGVVRPVNGVVRPVTGIGAGANRAALTNGIQNTANRKAITTSGVVMPVNGIATTAMRNSSNPLSGLGL